MAADGLLDVQAPREGAQRDRMIFAAVVSGDRAAFESLVRLHEPALHGFARRALRDEGDVLEVVQDTFDSAWRRRASYRGDAAVRTWLFAICKRKIVDSQRARRAAPVVDEVLDLMAAGHLSDPLVFAVNIRFLAVLESELRQLPDRQRVAWVMREIDGLHFATIGEALAVSPDAARGHHHRARRALSLRMHAWQ